MKKIIVEGGQNFDFGKTSKEYGKYRDIYPEELFDKLYKLGIGKEGTNWLDLGTGTGVIPGGIFLKVYMSYMKEEQITQDSNFLVKKINSSWNGTSASVKDLTTHYFDNPNMDTIIVDLPFTRENWHGRMMASRGVMASMDSEKIELFNKEHMAMLTEKYPEEFTVKHKLFLTWYYM